MDRNYPEPPPGGDPLGQLRREVIFSITETDWHVDELLHQVVALEEAVFARWPRSVLVRRRLRRDLRQSVEHIGGEDFASKRINTLASGWLERPGGPGRGRHQR